MSNPVPVYTPSSTPLRTKRNFKSLVLPDDPITPPVPDPIASRPAPRPGIKKRPPPLGEEDGSNGFILDPTIPMESPATGRRSAMHKTLSNTLAKLDLKAEVPKLDLKSSDLQKLGDIGQGNGGSVVKVQHIPTGTIMAMKVRTLFS
jgi:mitogen-activated protein kinase kinase